MFKVSTIFSIQKRVLYVEGRCSFVEIWTLQLIQSCLCYTLLLGCLILFGKSQELFFWASVDYVAVGLNLLKVSYISVYHPKDLFIHFWLFLFNFNLLHFWCITPTILRRFMFCYSLKKCGYQDRDLNIIPLKRRSLQEIEQKMCTVSIFLLAQNGEKVKKKDLPSIFRNKVNLLFMKKMMFEFLKQRGYMK